MVQPSSSEDEVQTHHSDPSRAGGLGPQNQLANTLSVLGHHQGGSRQLMEMKFMPGIGMKGSHINRLTRLTTDLC